MNFNKIIYFLICFVLVIITSNILKLIDINESSSMEILFLVLFLSLLGLVFVFFSILSGVYIFIELLTIPIGKSKINKETKK